MAESPKTPFTKTVADPSLMDLLDLLKKDIFLSLNCHAIATVQSFNAEARTVSAKIIYSKTYFQRSNKGNYVAVQKEYPILLDCPVVVLGGGSASLTFPISAGDECLILFNDRDIDNWAKGAKSGEVASSRAHSLSDGIALIGLNRPIENYDEDHALISWGDVKIGVSSSKVTLENASYSLLGVLTDLTTALTNLNTALGTAFGSPTPIAGQPLNPAAVTAIAAVQTQITNVQSEISGLLE